MGHTPEIIKVKGKALYLDLRDMTRYINVPLFPVVRLCLLCPLHTLMKGKGKDTIEVSSCLCKWQRFVLVNNFSQCMINSSTIFSLTLYFINVLGTDWRPFSCPYWYDSCKLLLKPTSHLIVCGVLVASHKDQFWVCYCNYMNDLNYSIISDISKFAEDKHYIINQIT